MLILSVNKRCCKQIHTKGQNSCFNDYSNETKGQCTNPLIRFDPIIGLAVGLVRRYPLPIHPSQGLVVR